DSDRLRRRPRVPAVQNRQRLPRYGRTRAFQRDRVDPVGDDLRPIYAACVRRAIFVLVPLIAWPTAASADTPTLTLKAPPATTYLHKIDFVGHLSPPAKDARVRLLRGTTLVASGRVRPDGSFVIPVRVANPGPFHVSWLHASSPEVTVRIRPRLNAQLLGSRVTGAQLRLLASLNPAAAGRVRVQ